MRGQTPRRSTPSQSVQSTALDVASSHPQPGVPVIRVQSSLGLSSTSPHLYAAFLTHDWGTDELGRDNHRRVSTINEALKAVGLKTWFDEEQMQGNIEDAMAGGIEKSACVCVFVTERYIRKAGGKGERGADDNCCYEFGYAVRRKGVGRIIPVVMEPQCRDPTKWKGVVGGRLGGLLYVDCSTDELLNGSMPRLIAEISKAQSATGSTVSPPLRIGSV